MNCPECSKPFGNPHGMKVHRARMHGVHPEVPPKREVVKAVIEQPDGARFEHERIPPATRERDGVVKLADLPWLTYPNTPEACDETLNAIAVAIENADRAMPFWLSLRAYVTALRKRLQLQKVAA